MSKPKNWDDDDTWGSDILGIGSCQGDITGKVKTRQIGFVRKAVSEVRSKSRVSNKGRSEADASRPKKT